MLAYVASFLSIAIYAPVRLLPVWMPQTDDPKVASPTGVCHAIPAMKNALRPKVGDSLLSRGVSGLFGLRDTRSSRQQYRKQQ
jgi:hypothetical protein